MRETNKLHHFIRAVKLVISIQNNLAFVQFEVHLALTSHFVALTLHFVYTYFVDLNLNNHCDLSSPVSFIGELGYPNLS